MKSLRRGIAMLLSTLVCLTALPVGSAAKVLASETDRTVKLQPSTASTFNDTDGDGFGEFEGWGTSLCWWANRIGYSEALTAEAAKVFFSDEGLDMNIGRYNIGGGDLVGTAELVPVNDKAVFYDLETSGYMPAYTGTNMKVNTISAMEKMKFTKSDADFGFTSGSLVGNFKAIGWINKLGDTPGTGDNLHYTVNVQEAGTYTVKLLLTLTGTNNRDVALYVNGVDEYSMGAAEINSNMIASGSNSGSNYMLFLITVPNVALQAGSNTVDIAGKSDWTLDFVKMAVIKAGEEGALPQGSEFLHNPHITRSDSEVPGYATNVTKIDTTKHELSWYADHFARADAQCGYAWDYDWNADNNQVNILKAAAAASGLDFIAEAFSNSPPYFMTNSGCSSGATNAGSDNLRVDSYEAFAAYLADVIAYWNEAGDFEFQSATPMNEPYTSYWGANSAKQEGCHFDQGTSQSKIIVALNRALQEKNLDIIISGTDETSIDTAITSYKALSDEAKGILERIDTHTYGGSNRTGLKTLAEDAEKNLWMSEVDGSYTAGTNAGEMSAALGLAKQIMKDENGLKSTAWILWNAIDMHVDSTKTTESDADYTSMENLRSRVDFNKGYWGIAIGDHDNQEILLTKKYYAYGQFSRYIRPGYAIINSGDDTLAAYDPENKKVVIVAVNTAAADQTWNFDLSNFSTISSTVTAIRTSGQLDSGENWADVSGTNITADTAKKIVTATLKANSITTYIVEGVTYDSSAEVISKVKDAAVYTIAEIPAVLPETVEVVTNKNNTTYANVSWNLEGIDLAKDVTVTGTVEGTDLPAAAKVQVVPANLVYLIDCNNPESPFHAAAKDYADIRNIVPDQAYTENSWGYLDTYGSYNGDSLDFYDCGWYAKSGQSIAYKIPLEAGEYEVILGFKEWWREGNKSRKMTVKAEQNGSAQILGTSNTWEGSNWWNRDAYSFTCNTDTEVTFTLDKVSGQPDPALSFLQIRRILDLADLKAAMGEAAGVHRSKYPVVKLASLDTAVQNGLELAMKSTATQIQINTAAQAIRNRITALGEGFTEEQIADNDSVLYLVNCGTPDASVVPENYKQGLYQSNVDQQYGADVTTQMSWGYLPNDENSPIVKSGTDASGITGSFIYMSDSIDFVKDVSGFKYAFELPERVNRYYKVTLGVKNIWDARTVDIVLEGKTVQQDLNLKKGTLIEQTYEVEVKDGQLNLMVHGPNRTSPSQDPILSYIVVEAVAPYKTDSLVRLLDSCRTAMESHTYSDATKEAFEAAAGAAQKLIDTSSTDQEAIKAAYDGLQAAFDGLKEIFDYTSITGTAGQQMFDNNGNKIQAHGGQIQQFTVDGVTKYYWYGEDKTNGYRPVVGVHLYTSTDLYNWTDEGVALRSIPVSEGDYGKDQESGYQADLSIFETDPYFKGLYGIYNGQQPDDTANYSSKLEEIYWNLAEDRTVIERPKVLYNEATGNYVMWFHADGRTPSSSADYGKARAGVAVSDTPGGPFRLLGTYRMYESTQADHSWDTVGGALRDMNLFQDDDGQGYVIYSSDGNTTMYIAKLNDAYTGLKSDSNSAVEGTGTEAAALTASDYTRNFINASREAPAMFKYQNKYYLITSGCTGWAPNQAQYAVADHPLGPWTVMGDPCVGDVDKKTFNTQSTCVFPVDAENGKFIYMGDRWMNPDSGGDLSDSRYVWLPVEFLSGNQIQLKDYANWTLAELENKGSFTVTGDFPGVVSTVSEILDGRLPNKVMVEDGSGKAEKDVTWTMDAYDENKLGVVNVTGTLADTGRSFTHKISIVNPKLIYFFDSGADTSEYFDLISQTLLGRLKNTVPDVKYSEVNGGGYLGVTNLENPDSFVLGLHNGNSYLSNGWYATSNQKIEYAFDLEAGTYTVSAGFQEWWNTTRPSKMTITSGSKTLVEKAFTIKSTETDLQVDEKFTISQGGTVKVSISKTGNPDPVISWISMRHDDAPVTKEKLGESISQAEKLLESDYTQETWTTLSQALGTAKALYKDTTADQQKVDTAVTLLKAAMESLQGITDKTQLEKMVAGIREKDGSYYTAASWQAYEQAVKRALEDAEKVLAKQSATAAEIEGAEQALTTASETAENGLVTIASILEAGITAHTVSESDKTRYTQDSWNKYVQALDAAKAFNGVNDEAAVMDALEALLTAKDALVLKPSLYPVTVNGGTGSGAYEESATVTITAGEAPGGKQFEKWVIVSGEITLGDSQSIQTTFKMPAFPVEVTAQYEGIGPEVTPNPTEPVAQVTLDTKVLPTAGGTVTVTVTGEGKAGAQVIAVNSDGSQIAGGTTDINGTVILTIPGNTTGKPQNYIIKAKPEGADEWSSVTAQVTVKAHFPFTDVFAGKWYYADVEYMWENGLMQGVADGRFAPNQTVTRGMLVTVLGRAAGVDVAKYTGQSRFTDVKESQYYAPYVKWAAETGIVKGVDAVRFNPNGAATREQIALVLFRYAVFRQMNLQQAESSKNFRDVKGLIQESQTAIERLTKAGIIKGRSDTVFDPKGKLTRAEVAALVHRLLEAAK